MEASSHFFEQKQQWGIRMKIIILPTSILEGHQASLFWFNPEIYNNTEIDLDLIRNRWLNLQYPRHAFVIMLNPLT